MEYLDALAEVISRRTPEELLGALIAALGIAVIPAIIMAVRRRRSLDTYTRQIALALAANVVSMVLASGYIQYVGHREMSPDAIGGHFNGIVFKGQPAEPMIIDPPWAFDHPPTPPGGWPHPGGPWNRSFPDTAGNTSAHVD